MAYSFDRFLGQDDEEQKVQGQAAPAMAASFGPAPVAAPAPASPNPQPQPAAGSGSGFVNFDRILNANRDAATATAGGMYADAAKKGDVAQGKINEAKNVYDSENASFRAAGNYGGQYKSMADLGGMYQGAMKSAYEAQQGVQALQSDAGRQAVLENKYGKTGNYSPGASRMDAALTGAVGGQKFAGLNQRFGKLTQSLTDANAAAAKSYNPNAPTATGPAAPTPGDSIEKEIQTAYTEYSNAVAAGKPADVVQKLGDEYSRLKKLQRKGVA